MVTIEEKSELYKSRDLAGSILAMWAMLHVEQLRKYPHGNGYFDSLAEHSDKYKAINDQIVAFCSDESIDQSQFAGDHCGFLAAQCEARQRVGIEPTDEQAQALIDRDERMNATIERNEKAEYLEYR